MLRRPWAVCEGCLASLRISVSAADSFVMYTLPIIRFFVLCSWVARVNGKLPSVLGQRGAMEEAEADRGVRGHQLTGSLASEELASDPNMPCILSGCGGFNLSAHSAWPK